MPKGISKDDPDYEEKRRRNNEAIRKSREKAKQKQKETQAQVDALKLENSDVEGQIKEMEGQLEILKGIFKAHASQPSSGQQAATAARVSNQAAAPSRVSNQAAAPFRVSNQAAAPPIGINQAATASWSFVQADEPAVGNQAATNGWENLGSSNNSEDLDTVDLMAIINNTG